MRTIPTRARNVTLLHTPAIIILKYFFAKMSEFKKNLFGTKKIFSTQPRLLIRVYEFSKNLKFNEKEKERNDNFNRKHGRIFKKVVG